MFDRTLATNGLIAILRGLPPEEAESIGSALYAAGIRIIEVPLNSPQPLRSLEILRRILPEDCLVGAGTVLSAEQVGIGAMKAWLAVLPPGTALLPVGGITPDNMAPYLRAGAAGFGLGSALYSPGLSADEVGRRALAFIQARRAAMV